MSIFNLEGFYAMRAAQGLVPSKDALAALINDLNRTAKNWYVGNGRDKKSQKLRDTKRFKRLQQGR